MMDKTANIARGGVTRIDETYWFNATRKRLAAAEETLTELDPHVPDSTRFLRQVATELPDEQRVSVLRAGLECIAGSLFPIPALAAAVVQAAPHLSRRVLELHPDPLAPKLLDEPMAARVLARLPDDPLERARAAGQNQLEGLSAPARLACTRELAHQSTSALLDRVSALNTVDASTLERGLSQAGQSELQIGAAMTDFRPDLPLVELTRSHLPKEWTGLVASLDPACENVEERTHLAAAAIHLAAQAEPKSVHGLALQLENPSATLAGALLPQLESSPTVAAWHEQATLLALSPQEELQGALQLYAAEPPGVAALVDEQLQKSDDPALPAALIAALKAKATMPDQQAWLQGLEACRGGRSALQAAQAPTPTNLDELFETFRPVLAESEHPLDVLGAALPHWKPLAADPAQVRMLELLEVACTGEQYEPSTIWKGVDAAIQEPGSDLVKFSSNLVGGMRFWMDADRVGAEALKAIEAQATSEKQTGLARAAHFLSELQDGFEEEHERHAVISEGLEWLSENAPSPGSWGVFARALRHATEHKHTDLVTGRLAARYLASESDPALAQKGRFLESVASMRSENLGERMEGLYDGLDRNGSLAFVAAGVADNFREAPLERQKVARLCFTEMSQTTEVRPKAMAELLLSLASQDIDLAWELLQPFDDEQLQPDPAWLGQMATEAVARSDRRAELSPVLLDGLDKVAAAWGDRKLLPKIIEKARQTGDLDALAEQLGQFQGDSYWLVSAAQGQDNHSQVEERNTHVIIGGVTVRKNQEE